MNTPGNQRPHASSSLSRRDLVIAGAALPLAGTTVISAKTACRAWLSQQRELRRLLIRWGDVEAELARTFGWYERTETERLSHPGQKALDEIDGEITALAQGCDALLPIIARAQASSPAEIMLKTRVAVEIVDATDAPEGHALLRSILRDLSACFQGQRR